jgi:hypothetical protein
VSGSGDGELPCVNGGLSSSSSSSSPVSISTL